MSAQQPTQEQLLLWYAERQTSAVETIRNYVFYLLLLALLGVILGVMVSLDAAMN